MGLYSGKNGVKVYHSECFNICQVKLPFEIWEIIIEKMPSEELMDISMVSNSLRAVSKKEMKKREKENGFCFKCKDRGGKEYGVYTECSRCLDYRAWG